MKRSYVYILASKRNGTLYTGVTSDLTKRIYQHKHKLTAGFTTKYGVDQLVFYQAFEDIETAIAREKQIKAGNRKRKIQLIETKNPNWNDLYDEICN